MHSQLSLPKTFTDEGFPAVPEGCGGGSAWAGSKDTVSLGLAVKYQCQAGSSLWAGWKCQQGRAPPGAWLCLQPLRAREEGRALPAWSSPQFQSSQPCHGQWVLLPRHPAAETGRGKALGQCLDTPEDTMAPQELLFCRKHSPGRMQGEF